MIDYEKLQLELKKGEISNCYIFYGTDEELMKDAIKNIEKRVVGNNYEDLNIIKYDGEKTSIEEIINSAETLPFFADKKVVTVYRCTFFKDDEKKEGNAKIKELKAYVKDLPPYTVLIFYCFLDNELEKVNKEINSFDKFCKVVKIDKFKGDKLERKVEEVFKSKGVQIGKIELKYFCEIVDANMNIIKNEVEKVINYCNGKPITKEAIKVLLNEKENHHIFNLVEFISIKRPEKAILVLNELLEKGENSMGIMAMIQRQFKLLYNIKVGLNAGKNKDSLAKEMRLHPYACEKLIGQSTKFNVKQLVRCMDESIKAEKELKTSSVNDILILEMLIINSMKN